MALAPRAVLEDRAQTERTALPAATPHSERIWLPTEVFAAHLETALQGTQPAVVVVELVRPVLRHSADFLLTLEVLALNPEGRGRIQLLRLHLPVPNGEVRLEAGSPALLRHRLLAALLYMAVQVAVRVEALHRQMQ